MKNAKPKGKSKTTKKPGRGGVRRNSGRKPNAAKAALARLIVDHIASAELCFGVLVEVALNKRKGAAVRVQAAIAVCNRVWGAPKQAVHLEGGAIERLLLSPPAVSPPPGVGPKA